MKKNILLTGRPRVGKSTLILRVIEKLRQRGFEKIGGFYTLEASREGKRSYILACAIRPLDLAPVSL